VVRVSIRRCFANIIENAVKCSKQAEVRLESDADEIIIRVEDGRRRGVDWAGGGTYLRELRSQTFFDGRRTIFCIRNLAISEWPNRVAMHSAWSFGESVKRSVCLIM
jgi:hypothetical protein